MFRFAVREFRFHVDPFGNGRRTWSRTTRTRTESKTAPRTPSTSLSFARKSLSVDLAFGFGLFEALLTGADVNITAYDVNGNGAWGEFHQDSVAQMAVKAIVALFSAIAKVIVEAASAAFNWIWGMMGALLDPILRPIVDAIRQWMEAIKTAITGLFSSFTDQGFFSVATLVSLGAFISALVSPLLGVMGILGLAAMAVFTILSIPLVIFSLLLEPVMSFVEGLIMAAIVGAASAVSKDMGKIIEGAMVLDLAPMMSLFISDPSSQTKGSTQPPPSLPLLTFLDLLMGFVGLGIALAVGLAKMFAAAWGGVNLVGSKLFKFIGGELDAIDDTSNADWLKDKSDTSKDRGKKSVQKAKKGMWLALVGLLLSSVALLLTAISISGMQVNWQTHNLQYPQEAYNLAFWGGLVSIALGVVAFALAYFDSSPSKFVDFIFYFTTGALLITVVSNIIPIWWGACNLGYVSSGPFPVQNNPCGA